MNKHNFLKIITAYVFAVSGAAHAASITWIAQAPNNDMENPSNWNPNTVPSGSDNAIFDSTIPGIATNPTENFAAFAVSNLTFTGQASNFTFDFNNQKLTLNDAGITGNTTNPTINVTNLNNSSFPGDLVSFTGPLSTSGSANITSSNSATLTGNVSGTGIGAFGSNFHSSGPFSISNFGQINAENTGTDSSIGTGNNGTANTASSQLQFDQSFTAGNNVTVSVSNNGTFSGSNSTQGDAVNIVNGSQFISSGPFQAGNDFACELQNAGTDSSTGIGLSNIGQLNAAQMRLPSGGTAGNNCSITISNTATNSSQSTTFPDFVGYLNDQQFIAEGPFQAGHDFDLTVTNTGTDTSSGHGASMVAAINSNSGVTGDQILFKQGCALGDRASISASNNGTYNGTNTGGGSSVGLMNRSQITIGDSLSPGSYAFNAGDDFSISATSIGNDSAHGLGSDVVGTVSTDQISIYAPCSVGKNAQFNLFKGAFFNGQTSSSFVTVGSTGGSLLNCASTFQAGDGFILNINNTGTHAGIGGAGNDFIAHIATGQQAGFHGSATFGDDARIFIYNSGSTFSNTTAANQVSSIFGYGKQLLFGDAFQAGDNLEMLISNSGSDLSSGAGGSYTAFINNNTVDQTASQLHLAAGGILGNRASITLENTGTYQGSNTTGGSNVGVLAGQQFCSANIFTAGDYFGFSANNSGTSNASGQSNHTIGLTAIAQFDFNDNCNLGDNASIVITNTGTNNDPTGLSNKIGYIAGSQMRVSGNFNAGLNLNMTATNTAVNNGDSSNLVGHVEGSQILFGQQCQLDNGSSIAAFNSGTVENSQIEFNQGFDIQGKAVIQAVNSGSLGFKGIYVQGSSLGGNANIVLENSSLYVDTSLPTFTIGELNGDALSTVESNPLLIIDTDASVNADFSGSIQNFPSAVSSLTKKGTGIQKLSGINTYTGLTSIDAGTLVLNGSTAGSVTVNAFGTLKGIGTVGGNLINYGTVSPGESIGTLRVLGNYVNNGGIYAVEVNGLGQSDLILVDGTATLNGGPVEVSSTDGTFLFNQPYTIVTAGAGVTGTFSGAVSRAFINPLLTYNRNNVYLTINSGLIKAAKSCNQIGVAGVLDSISNPNAAQILVISKIANLPLEKAQEALESLSGFQYTQDVWSTEMSTQRLMRRMYNPLRSQVSHCACCDPDCGWTAWLEMGDSLAHVNGKNAHKMRTNSFEATGGIQKCLCDNFTAGVAGSYVYDSARYKQGKGSRNTEYLVAYGLYRPCLFYGLVDLVYGHTSNKLSRRIDVNNLRYNVNGKPNINTFAAYGEAGFDINYGCLLIQPFLGIQTGKNWRKRVNEGMDSQWGLSIGKYDWASTSSRLGLHFSACNFCNCFNISFDVAWDHRWSCSKNSTVGRFNNFGGDFRICGTRLDRDSFDYALTLSTCFSDRFAGYFELGGETWQHANSFDIAGGFTYSW